VIPYTLAKVGSYSCQAQETFPDGKTTGNSSGCVSFQPPTGAQPTIASISVEVPYVQLKGLAFSGTVFAGANIGRVNQPCSAWNVHDVILANLTAPSFALANASYLYLEGGSYGPLLNQASHINGCKDSAGTYQQGSHLAINGITMHDYRQTQRGAHMECIHYNGSDTGLIINSRFLNCGQQDISFQTNNLASSINTLLIQNNIFDAACSHAQPGDVCGVVSGGTTTFICDHAGETLTNITMRFNTLNGSPSFQRYNGCAMSSLTLEGNILTGPSTYACTSNQAVGVTFLYNAYTNTTAAACGPGNILGATPTTTWVNPTNYDYHLLRGSRAIDVMLSTTALPFMAPNLQLYPSRDIDGTSRPQALAPDAGAYEYL
jgi:hypothetical protein